jgi:hypothetical protein
MPDELPPKTIPDLDLAESFDENSDIPFDTGIVTKRIKGDKFAQSVLALLEQQRLTLPFKQKLNPQLTASQALRLVSGGYTQQGTSGDGLSAGKPCFSPEQGKLVVPLPNDFYVSEDHGNTWSTESAPASSDPSIWTAAAYSPELDIWAAVGADNLSASEFQIASSPDAETWTGRTNPTGEDLWDVKWIDWLGKYVAVGSAGAVCTSSNGTDWTDVSIDTSENLVALAVSHYQQRVVAVGDGVIFWSEDLAEWNEVDLGELAESLQSVVWSKVHQMYVAGGATSGLWSYDAEEWFQIAGPALAFGLSVSEEAGLFYSVIEDDIAYSYDGKTFTAITSVFSAPGYLRSIFIPQSGRFVLLNGNLITGHPVAMSRIIKKLISSGAP